MAAQFEAIIDRTKKTYGCTVIYFTTDSDGSSKKGRVILEKKDHGCWLCHAGLIRYVQCINANDLADIIQSFN